MKKYLSFCTLFLFLFTFAHANEFQVPVYALHEASGASVHKTANDFYVTHNGQTQEVKKHWNDKLLNTMTDEQLKAFLVHGYITLNKMSTGEFSLKTHTRGVGGGAVGATVGAAAGATAVQATWGASIWLVGTLVSLVAGPVAGAGAAVAFRFWTAPAATYATKVAALSGGIALGSMTGPL